MLSEWIDPADVVARERRWAKMWIKAHRHSLFAAWPYCHWCGREVRLWERPAHRLMPIDAATYDHLFHRRHPDAIEGPHIGVLACLACNRTRGEDDRRVLAFGVLPDPFALPEWWALLLKLTEAR